MKHLLLCACCLSAGLAVAEVSDCYVRMTVTEYTNLVSQVSALWTAHTNRLAQVEARRKEAAKRREPSAIDKVRVNAEKHKRRSAMGKSSGGVK